MKDLAYTPSSLMTLLQSNDESNDPRNETTTPLSGNKKLDA